MTLPVRESTPKKVLTAVAATHRSGSKGGSGCIRGTRRTRGKALRTSIGPSVTGSTPSKTFSRGNESCITQCTGTLSRLVRGGPRGAQVTALQPSLVGERARLTILAREGTRDRAELSQRTGLTFCLPCSIVAVSWITGQALRFPSLCLVLPIWARGTRCLSCQGLIRTRITEGAESVTWSCSIPSFSARKALRLPH